MNVSIEMVLAAAAFIAGMLFVGSRNKGSLKELFKREEEKTDDQSKYNAARLRMRLLHLRAEKKRKEAEARGAADRRKSDSDAITELRDKLDSY